MEKLFYNINDNSIWSKHELKKYHKELIEMVGDTVEPDFDYWLKEQLDLDYISLNDYLNDEWEDIEMAMDNERKDNLHNELAACDHLGFLVEYVNRYKDIDEFLKVKFKIEANDLRKRGK